MSVFNRLLLFLDYEPTTGYWLTRSQIMDIWGDRLGAQLLSLTSEVSLQVIVIKPISARLTWKVPQIVLFPVWISIQISLTRMTCKIRRMNRHHPITLLVEVVSIKLVCLFVHMELQWFEYQLSGFFLLRGCLGKREIRVGRNCLDTLFAKNIRLEDELLLTLWICVIAHEVSALDRLHRR